jgi:hypothetical protein
VGKRTYDHIFLCRQFYVLTAAIREQTQIMRENRCPGESSGDYITPPEESCLRNYFTAVQTGEFVGDCLTAVSECPECSAVLSAIKKRRELKTALNGLKRQIFNAGKAEAPHA